MASSLRFNVRQGGGLLQSLKCNTMNKSLFLWLCRNNVIWRKIITAPGRYTFETMQVPETLMLQGVDQDALFELAYDAGLQEPDNVVIGATLESALSDLADKCGLEIWEDPESEEYPKRCHNCDGTGEGRLGEWSNCVACGGSGVLL